MAGYEKASWTEPGVPFKFDGSSRICPMCHVFIVKGRSWAVRLPKPVVPRTSDGRFSDDTGEPYYWDGHRIPSPDRPRWYAHHRCWLRYSRGVLLFGLETEAAWHEFVWTELNKWLDREVFKCRRTKR